MTPRYVPLPPTVDGCRWCRSKVSGRYCAHPRVRQLSQPFQSEREIQYNAVEVSRAIVACQGEYFSERARWRIE